MLGRGERCPAARAHCWCVGIALYHHQLLLRWLRSSVDAWVALTPGGDLYVEGLVVSDDIREVFSKNVLGEEPAPLESVGGFNGFEAVGVPPVPVGQPTRMLQLGAPGPPWRQVIAVDSGDGKVPRGAEGVVERLRGGKTREEYLARTAGCRGAGDGSLDSQVPPVTYSTLNVGQRLLRETVAMMSEVAFTGWPLPEPRRVNWCASFVDRRGASLVGHLCWWVGRLHCQGAVFGVQKGDFVVRAFQFSGKCDLVRLPVLVGLEVILFQGQLIEYHYEKMRKAREEALLSRSNG